jgi:hypothetical protein
MSNLTRTTVLLLLIMEIAGCGSSEPECGSSTTTAIVTKIAKDNAPNKLTRYVMQRAESAPPFCDLISG